jgi:hypothetical protein
MANHERFLRYYGDHHSHPVRPSHFGSTQTGVVRMNLYSWLQIAFYLVVLIALAKPLGSFMAGVYRGERTFHQQGNH